MVMPPFQDGLIKKELPSAIKRRKDMPFAVPLSLIQKNPLKRLYRGETARHCPGCSGTSSVQRDAALQQPTAL